MPRELLKRWRKSLKTFCRSAANGTFYPSARVRLQTHSLVQSVSLQVEEMSVRAATLKDFFFLFFFDIMEIPKLQIETLGKHCFAVAGILSG